MREHALRSFRRDLAASIKAPVSWEEGGASLQHEHAVPGGVGEEERRQVFEQHVAALRARDGGGPTAQQVRVDVSDLGLTMDDLSGPFGFGDDFSR